jgi:hypothetical protein
MKEHDVEPQCDPEEESSRISGSPPAVGNMN